MRFFFSDEYHIYHLYAYMHTYDLYNKYICKGCSCIYMDYILQYWIRYKALQTSCGKDDIHSFYCNY